MKIGELQFKERPVFLAPMEDVTDPAFRRICKRFGADMVYTEFVSADALIRSVKKTEQKLTISDIERPVAIQIYGKDVDTMVEAAKIVESAKPDIIDINFGCPVKKVAGKGAGAGLLRDIPKLLEITAAVVKAVNTPVTVKTRLGWDDNSKIITTLAESIQDAGAQALAIHGRTRAQMYNGTADWTLIGQVKENPRMRIPIIGNGDVTTAQIARDNFDKYGVDAIMIGRAAIGQPWIFRQVRSLLDDGIEKEPLTFAEQIDILKEHINAAIEWVGDERRGLVHSRRHIAVTPTLKGIKNFRPTRIKLLRSESREEIFSIFDELVNSKIIFENDLES